MKRNVFDHFLYIILSKGTCHQDRPVLPAAVLFFLPSSVSVRSVIPAKDSRHMNTPKDHPGINPVVLIIRNASAFLPRRARCEAPS